MYREINAKEEEEKVYHSTSIHVTNISCNTRWIDNIIEVQNRHQGIHLHQQCQGLSYSSGSTQYCYFESGCSSFRPAIRPSQWRTSLHLLAWKTHNIKVKFISPSIKLQLHIYIFPPQYLLFPFRYGKASIIERVHCASTAKMSPRWHCTYANCYRVLSLSCRQKQSRD